MYTDPIPAVAKRLGRWAIGTPVELWRYATRPTKVYRSVVQVEDDDPSLLERSRLPRQLREDVQPARGGVGPEFNRTYAARITDADGDARGVIQILSRDFRSTVPEGIAMVEETDHAPLAVGDEVAIHLAGPWDAPVRVIDVGEHHFRFATLAGHMEAGEIEFRTEDGTQPGEVELTIESWARSSTLAFAALYHPLGLAQEVQLHMWATVIERVAGRSGGRIEDGIRVITRRRRAVEAADG